MMKRKARRPGRGEDGKVVWLKANERGPNTGRVIEGTYSHMNRSPYFFMRFSHCSIRSWGTDDLHEAYFTGKEWDLIEPGEQATA